MGWTGGMFLVLLSAIELTFGQVPGVQLNPETNKILANLQSALLKQQQTQGLPQAVPVQQQQQQQPQQQPVLQPPIANVTSNANSTNLNGTLTNATSISSPPPLLTTSPSTTAAVNGTINAGFNATNRANNATNIVTAAANANATTESPCAGGNITICFQLISEEMNRTEELLRMANQTLAKEGILVSPPNNATQPETLLGLQLAPVKLVPRPDPKNPAVTVPVATNNEDAAKILEANAMKSDFANGERVVALNPALQQKRPNILGLKNVQNGRRRKRRRADFEPLDLDLSDGATSLEFGKGGLIDIPELAKKRLLDLDKVDKEKLEEDIKAEEVKGEKMLVSDPFESLRKKMGEEEESFENLKKEMDEADKSEELRDENKSKEMKDVKSGRVSLEEEEEEKSKETTTAESLTTKMATEATTTEKATTKTTSEANKYSSTTTLASTTMASTSRPQITSEHGAENRMSVSEPAEKRRGRPEAEKDETQDGEKKEKQNIDSAISDLEARIKAEKELATESDIKSGDLPPVEKVKAAVAATTKTTSIKTTTTTASTATPTTTWLKLPEHRILSTLRKKGVGLILPVRPHLPHIVNRADGHQLGWLDTMRRRNEMDKFRQLGYRIIFKRHTKEEDMEQGWPHPELKKGLELSKDPAELAQKLSGDPDLPPETRTSLAESAQISRTKLPELEKADEESTQELGHDLDEMKDIKNDVENGNPVVGGGKTRRSVPNVLLLAAQQQRQREINNLPNPGKPINIVQADRIMGGEEDNKTAVVVANNTAILNQTSLVLPATNLTNNSSFQADAPANLTKFEKEEVLLSKAPKGLILKVVSPGESNLKVGQFVDGNLEATNATNLTSTETKGQDLTLTLVTQPQVSNVTTNQTAILDIANRLQALQRNQSQDVQMLKLMEENVNKTTNNNTQTGLNSTETGFNVTTEALPDDDSNEKQTVEPVESNIGAPIQLTPLLTPTKQNRRPFGLRPSRNNRFKEILPFPRRSEDDFDLKSDRIEENVQDFDDTEDELDKLFSELQESSFKFKHHILPQNDV